MMMMLEMLEMVVMLAVPLGTKKETGMMMKQELKKSLPPGAVPSASSPG
jgi:hypothetical protein